MFNNLNNAARIQIIQAAINYISQTSSTYDPDDLKEKLPIICDVLAAYLLSHEDE